MPPADLHTTEDETELDQASPEDLARKVCPEYLKAQAAHEARKKKDEPQMRIYSGFMIGAIWILSYNVGTVFMLLVPFVFSVFVFSELRRIKNDVDIEKSSGLKKVEWMLFGLSTFMMLPVGAFRPEILENSGFTPETNPILYAALFDHFILLVTVFTIVIFLTFIIGLKKETVKYQINHFFFSLIAAFYASTTAASQHYVAYYGRYWYHFPMMSVAFNDVAAYVVGKNFGRTKLIGLSPKKTVEGFVGGLVVNIVMTLCFLDYWLQGNNFWTCAPMRLTWRPFEDY